VKKKTLILFLIICFLVSGFTVPSYATSITAPAGMSEAEALLFYLMSYGSIKSVQDGLEKVGISEGVDASQWNADMNDYFYETLDSKKKMFLDAVSRNDYDLSTDFEDAKQLFGVTFNDFTEELNFKKDVLYSRVTNTITKEQLGRHLDMSKIGKYMATGYQEIIKHLPDANGVYPIGYNLANNIYSMGADTSSSKFGYNLNLGLSDHKIINHVYIDKYSDHLYLINFDIYDYSVDTPYYLNINYDFCSNFDTNGDLYFDLNAHDNNCIGVMVKNKNDSDVIWCGSSNNDETTRGYFNTAFNDFIYKDAGVDIDIEPLYEYVTSTIELPNGSNTKNSRRFVNFDTMRTGFFFNNIDAWGQDYNDFIDLYQMTDMSTGVIEKQLNDIDVYNSSEVSSLGGSGGDTPSGTNNPKSDDWVMNQDDMSKYNVFELVDNLEMPSDIIYSTNPILSHDTHYETRHTVAELNAAKIHPQHVFRYCNLGIFYKHFQRDGYLDYTFYIPAEVQHVDNGTTTPWDLNGARIYQNAPVLNVYNNSMSFNFPSSEASTFTWLRGSIEGSNFEDLYVEFKVPVNSSVGGIKPHNPTDFFGKSLSPANLGNGPSGTGQATVHGVMPKIQYCSVPMVYKGDFTDLLIHEQWAYEQIRYSYIQEHGRRQMSDTALDNLIGTYPTYRVVDYDLSIDTPYFGEVTTPVEEPVTDPTTGDVTNNYNVDVDMSPVVSAVNDGTSKVSSDIKAVNASVQEGFKSVTDSWAMDNSYFLDKFNHFRNELAGKYDVDMDEMKRLATDYKKPFEDNEYINIDGWYPYIEEYFRPISTALIVLIWMRFNLNNVLKLLGAATMSEAQVQIANARIERNKSKGGQ
jgi:hypothetical protein